MRHNTMNARMKMWQGYTDCMTWNVNKRKQTAGGWERAGGHRLATVRGLRLWLCLDWLITELICIFFNFKQTTNFSTIHLQNVIHQSGCGRTSVKNLLEFWDRLYARRFWRSLFSMQTRENNLRVHESVSCFISYSKFIAPWRCKTLMGVFLPLFASSFEFPESFKLAMQFHDLVKFLNILLEDLKSFL